METILSVIALIVSAISAFFALFSFFWTNNRDRKQATLEAYNRLQHEVFDELNKLTPEEIRNICNDVKSRDYKTISGYVARIEHFCVGLNEKIYDKKTFYALAHGYFDGNQLTRRIEPLIETKNQNNKKGSFYNNTKLVIGWMNKINKKKAEK